MPSNIRTKGQESPINQEQRDELASAGGKLPTFRLSAEGL